MEGINSKRIQFFKDKIKNRLVELKPYMSDVKYRMYMSVINDCKDLEELREMVEMDMQFNMVKYINELTDKIKLSDTSIDELEAVINQNARAARLTVIVPKKKDKVPIYEEVAQNMDEMLEDKEVLEASANILWQRLNSQVPPELDLSDMNEEEDTLGLDSIDTDEEEIDPYDDAALEEQEEEEYIDNISLDDFESDDELDDFESDEELDDFESDEEEIDPYDDAALEEQEQEEEEELDSNSNEEEVIDFGLSDEQSKQLIENEKNKLDVSDDLDLLDIDEMFGDDEDEEESDLDDITEDMLDSEDDEEDDIDIDDMYGDDEEEDEEFDIDSMYGDEEDEEEDEDEEEFDIEDMYGDEEDEEDEEPDWDDIDSIDPNDIFGDDDEEDYDEEEESDEPEEDELNPDDMYGDEEDEFDIDESDLDGDIEEDSHSEDDLSKLFDTGPKANPAPIKREKTQDKIFINGTQRGKQTQDMFNAIFGFANKVSRMRDNIRR